MVLILVAESIHFLKVIFPLLKEHLKKLHSVSQSSGEVQFNEFLPQKTEKVKVALRVFNLYPGNSLHAWRNSIKIQWELKKLTQS